MLELSWFFKRELNSIKKIMPLVESDREMEKTVDRYIKDLEALPAVRRKKAEEKEKLIYQPTAKPKCTE